MDKQQVRPFHCYGGSDQICGVVAYAVKGILYTTVHVLIVREVVSRGLPHSYTHRDQVRSSIEISGLLLTSPWSVVVLCSRGSISYDGFREQHCVLHNAGHRPIRLTEVRRHVASQPIGSNLYPHSPRKEGIPIVPSFTDNRPRSVLADLKARCEAARVLGIVRCNVPGALVIYDSKQNPR